MKTIEELQQAVLEADQKLWLANGQLSLATLHKDCSERRHAAALINVSVQALEAAELDLRAGYALAAEHDKKVAAATDTIPRRTVTIHGRNVNAQNAQRLGLHDFETQFRRVINDQRCWCGSCAHQVVCYLQVLVDEAGPSSAIINDVEEWHRKAAVEFGHVLRYSVRPFFTGGVVSTASFAASIERGAEAVLPEHLVRPVDLMGRKFNGPSNTAWDERVAVRKTTLHPGENWKLTVVIEDDGNLKLTSQNAAGGLTLYREYTPELFTVLIRTLDQIFQAQHTDQADDLRIPFTSAVYAQSCFCPKCSADLIAKLQIALDAATVGVPAKA